VAFDLSGLLQKYMGGNMAPNPNEAVDHFHEVAQSASPDAISAGLAEAFRSDATPPFGQMAGQLFGQANAEQRAGMLNQLLGGMAPSVLASLAGRAGGATLGGLLGQLSPGGTPASITPAQASQFTPEQVREIATHAEQHNPSVVDKMSDFYAQHTGLVKTLGGAVLAVALAKMANNRGG